MDKIIQGWLKIPIYFKFLGVFGLWILFGLGFYFFIFEDQEQAYKKLVMQYKSIDDSIIKLQNIQQNLANIKKKAISLQKQLKVAQSQLPKRKDLEKLIQSIDTQAQDIGLSVFSYKPGGEKKGNIYTRIPFNLATKGSFFEIMKFLGRLQTLPRIVSVNSITFSPAGVRNNQMDLSASLRMYTYRYYDKDVVKLQKKIEKAKMKLRRKKQKSLGLKTVRRKR